MINNWIQKTSLTLDLRQVGTLNSLKQNYAATISLIILRVPIKVGFLFIIVSSFRLDYRA